MLLISVFTKNNEKKQITDKPSKILFYVLLGPTFVCLFLVPQKEATNYNNVNNTDKQEGITHPFPIEQLPNNNIINVLIPAKEH